MRRIKRSQRLFFTKMNYFILSQILNKRGIIFIVVSRSNNSLLAIVFLNHPLLALYINFVKSKIISKINNILLLYVLVNIWQHRWKNVNSGTQDKKHCSMRMKILESVTEKSHRTRIKSVNVSQKHTQSFSQISLPFFRFNFCFALKCHPMSHLRVLNVPQKCHILFERPLVSCVWHYLLIFIQNPMKFVEEEEEG